MLADYVSLWCLVVCILCNVDSVSGGKEDKMPFMSQFEEDFAYKGQRSEPFAAEWESVHVVWLRQREGPHSRTLTLKYDSRSDTDPQVAWRLNGRWVHSADRTFPQTTEKRWLKDIRRHERSATIAVPHMMDVTSLQLLLVLNVTESLTDINLQPIQGEGRTILEYGTDVALALTSEEDVRYEEGDDVVLVTRFFAEDLREGNYSGLKVSYRTMVPHPTLAMSVATSGEGEGGGEGEWRKVAVRKAVADDLPTALRDTLESPLRDQAVVTVSPDKFNTRGLLELSAAYTNNIACRLFGGQQITRRIFLRAKGDTGQHWGRGGNMVYLPYRQTVPVRCHDFVDVGVTVFGERSPYVYLVKDGQILEDNDDVSIFLFRRMLSTEAVFRFNGVTPEMSGRYEVWAENGLGRTDETSFTLVLDDESC